MKLKLHRLKLTFLALNSAFNSVNSVNFRNVGISHAPYSIFLENNSNVRKRSILVGQGSYSSKVRTDAQHTPVNCVRCVSGCDHTTSDSIRPDLWKRTPNMEEESSPEQTGSGCDCAPSDTIHPNLCQRTPHMEEESTPEQICSNAVMYGDVEHPGWKLKSDEFLKFPLDPVKENYVRRNVPNAVFSVVQPTPLEGETVLAAVSPTALDLLDLDPSVASSTRCV